MSKFLIVDDNVVTARVLAKLLRYEGHEAASVNSGPDALRVIESQPPQVVLLDWMMPGMDGPSVLRALRSNPRFDRVRVVMFSAISEPSRVGDTLRMGAYDYIVKGTPWEKMYSRLCEIVDQAN